MIVFYVNFRVIRIPKNKANYPASGRKLKALNAKSDNKEYQYKVEGPGGQSQVWSKDVD